MNEQIIERLKKILRLADNAAATPGEIDAAMGKAKEIAMQNNIDLALLDFSDPNAKAAKIETDQVIVSTTTTREHAQHGWICSVIKNVFGVFIVTLRKAMDGRPRYAFIGEKSDTAIAKEIFPWLESVFLKSYHAQIKACMIRHCAGDRNAFYHGMADGLIQVNRKTVKETLAKQHVDENKYAMVLRNKDVAIKEAIVYYYPILKTAKARRTEYNDGVRGLGEQEGRKINLHQVAGTATRQALK